MLRLDAFDQLTPFIFWRRKRDSNPRAPFDANGFQEYFTSVSCCPASHVPCLFSTSYERYLSHAVVAGSGLFHPVDLHGICSASRRSACMCNCRAAVLLVRGDRNANRICNHCGGPSYHPSLREIPQRTSITDGGATRDGFDALADVPRTGYCLFFRASRTRPRRKRIALRVFGSPNFPKTVRKIRFQKSAPPKRLPATRSRLRSWCPVVRQQHARKAFAAPFSLRRRAVVEGGTSQNRLGSGCGYGDR